jgi:hypothetical protein
MPSGRECTVIHPPHKFLKMVDAVFRSSRDSIVPHSLHNIVDRVVPHGWHALDVLRRCRWRVQTAPGRS